MPTAGLSVVGVERGRTRGCVCPTGRQEFATPESLRAAGLCKGVWDEVKVLGNGTLSKALKVSAHRFSAQAREKITAAGGSVTGIPGPAAVERKPSKKAAKKTSPKPPTAGSARGLPAAAVCRARSSRRSRFRAGETSDHLHDPERLRQKILLTLGLLAIYRVGWQVPLPIVDAEGDDRPRRGGGGHQ